MPNPSPSDNMKEEARRPCATSEGAGTFLLLQGDCRKVMPAHGPFDLIIGDPPYNDTSLAWDRRVHGWLRLAAASLKPTGSLWLFGSMRSFLGSATEIARARLRYAQDLVWEKPNGTGFAADRFKRVHEHAVQFYRAGSPWADVYNDVQRTRAAEGANKSARIRRPDRAPQAGSIRAVDYIDDGFRIERTVQRAPSVRGGVHKTEKPVELLSLIIRTSCPEGGLVGDFFAGSGAAGEAAMRAGRRYFGCEIDDDMAARANQRIANAAVSHA
jgi:site-specific DNA-methyltransferase (adenine-specific)